MYARILCTMALLTLLAGSFRADETPKKPAAQNKGKADATKALKLYHKTAVEAFIDTPGFGHERMPIMRRTVERFDIQWTSEDIDREGPAAKIAALETEHRKRVGLMSADPRKAFKLPGFRTAPLMQDAAKTTWKLRSVDLVAVVDREKPIVHITVPSYTVPAAALENLKNVGPGNPLWEIAEKAARTREPDLLELAALDRFKDGEELVIRAKGNVLRMVGALRATKQCLKCHHDSKEGDLFGAFTYTLKKASN